MRLNQRSDVQGWRLNRERRVSVCFASPKSATVHSRTAREPFRAIDGRLASFRVPPEAGVRVGWAGATPAGLQRTATAQGRSQQASSPATATDATVALARRPHTRFVVARSALKKREGQTTADSGQPTCPRFSLRSLCSPRQNHSPHTPSQSCQSCKSCQKPSPDSPDLHG